MNGNTLSGENGMPNPSGVNSFNHFAPEPAYGEVTQQKQLEQAAPVPQNPALNAARRAQRSTQRPPGDQAAAPAAGAPPQEQPSPQIILAQQWAEIAAIPGIDPIAADMARRAAGG
jgi:hypothetical protein